MERAGLLRNNITEARLRTLPVVQIWKSRQNGMVYDPRGIAPCLCVGNHSGVEPKIIEYVDSGRNNSNSPDKG